MITPEEIKTIIDDHINLEISGLLAVKIAEYVNGDDYDIAEGIAENMSTDGLTNPLVKVRQKRKTV
jgi:hypothetical protein